MAQGHDWTQPPFSRKVYYWPFWKTFLVLLVFFMVILFGSWILLWGREFVALFNDDYGPISIALVSAISLGLTAVFYKFARVDLTPQTIATMNDLSIRQTMPLSSIVRATKPWYGVGLLLLLKQEGVVCRLWIPLFMVGWDDFANSVRQVTPPDNPLHTFIDSHQVR